jgi:predicted metal-dependent HD superfamily phosphohydrolase
MDEELVQILVAEGITATQKNNDPLTTHHYYHNGSHAQMAHDCFRVIAQIAHQSGRITSEDLDLGRIIMAWHDETQSLGSGLNELESAKNTAKAMRKHGLAEPLITRVEVCIPATIISFVSGIVHQQAESMNDYLAYLVADADLCSIGFSTGSYIRVTRNLIMEYAGKAVLTPEEWRSGWAKQVTFLTNRRFLSEEANSLWGNQLQSNLETAKKLAQS